MNFCANVAQTSFHRKTVVALQNVSWFQAIPHHVNILLMSSSSLWTVPPDVIFYFTIFNLYFLSSVLKMPCEYHFVLYIFLNTGSLLTLRLIHQTGLTDNIDEVIKEYKETRGLLVWEAFHPWYIMFWYLNCMWHSLHNSHFLLANRRFMWEMREGIGWKGPFCICCISLHASSLFLALLLLGWKELMETIIMQATQFLLDF